MWTSLAFYQNLLEREIPCFIGICLTLASHAWRRARGTEGPLGLNHQVQRYDTSGGSF